MTHPEPHSGSDPGENTLLPVCIAMMMGVVIFLATAWFVTPEEGFLPGMDASLVQALATLSLLFLVGASLFETRRRRTLEASPPSDLEQAQRTTTLVAFALREGAGMMAVVVGLLSGRMGFATILAGVVLVLMALSLPKTR